MVSVLGDYGSSDVHVVESYASSTESASSIQELPNKKKQATFGTISENPVAERDDEDLRPELKSSLSYASLPGSQAASLAGSITAGSVAGSTISGGRTMGSNESVLSMNSSTGSRKSLQLTRRRSGLSLEVAASPKMGHRVSLQIEPPVSRKQSLSIAGSASEYTVMQQNTTLNRRVSVRTGVADLSDSVTASTKLTNSSRSASATHFGSLRRCFKQMKQIGRRLLESYGVQGLMAFLTVFVLVGDDIRLLAFEKSADWVFNLAAILCLSLFTLELTISSLVKEDYFLGFWFFMDAISTATLVFDITYVSQAIDPPPELSLDNPDSINSGNSAVGNSEYARASRSSRVGTRVARLLRVIRLMRISRVTKLFSFQKKQESDAVLPGEDSDRNLEQGSESESRIGRKLSERVTQRVIILVLIMLFVIPQLNAGLHHLMMSSSAQYGADVIFSSWVNYEQQYLKNSSAIHLLEPLRRIWETDVLMYIYYHNWHSIQPEESQNKQTNAADWLTSLCFIGYLINKAADADVLDNMQQGYIQALSPTIQNWDGMFSPSHWDFNKYIVGNIPHVIKKALAAPWTTDCSEESGFYGVSLLPGTPCPRKEFRKEETMWYLPSGTQMPFSRTHMQGQFVFLFDLRRRIAMQAVMSISQTVFAIIVLAIGALGFSKDADRLVLAPIERMIRNVIIIRRDPLYAIKLAEKHLDEEDNYGAISTTATVPRFRRFIGCCCLSKQTVESIASRLKLRSGTRPPQKSHEKQHKKNVPKKGTMETMILENAIVKLGSLLVLGFGDAGSEIIKLNMDDDTGTVNALIPGSKVEGIYGFCSIRHFATTINVLQEKTMVFVNQVAEIVHRVVDEHLGAANKNVGEAFLLVWRLSSYAPERRSKIADLAVLSFVQIMVELSRDVRLSEYREHPALLARLPSFRVTMGFGLHLGWSIEGAIGSEFKIDASYLSPHVNLASLLEAASDEYGVSVLMSEPLVTACSLLFRRRFRAIDHVKFFGSKFPIRLFTVDLNQEALPVDVDDIAKRCKPRLTRESRDLLKFARVNDDSSSADALFDCDINVVRMRERYFLNFLQEFEKGYLNYEAGEWGVATKVLTNTMVMLRRCSSEGLVIAEDGPSKVLVEFMERHNCEKPEGWPGYRELSERGTNTSNLETFDEFSEGILSTFTTQ